ncbi:hypothetical protein H2203_003819 [Taxawa tesnikishii (nom. ined.)]|nr:hypothetical protein H2203_003819 [Dothideales sp. JES 119]
MVGRKEDTLTTIAKLRRLPTTDERVQTEWRGIIAETEFQQLILERMHPGKTGLKLEIATWLDLFKKKNWRRTAVGCGVAFFQQFSGINGFIYYAPILFRSIGQSDESSLVLSGILNIVQLVAVLACFFIIDHVGRRPLAIWCGFGMAVPYIIMAALVGLYSADWASHVSAGWATTAMAFIYIFTNASRAKGVALSTATVWLCNFIVGLIVPPMIEQAGFGTYVFFGIMCILSGLWAWWLVPETKGKTLEQMDKVFGDDSAAQEKEIMREAAMQARREAAQVEKV